MPSTFSKMLATSGSDQEGNIQTHLILRKRKRRHPDLRSEESVDSGIQRGKTKASADGAPPETKSKWNIINISSTDSSSIFVSDQSIEVNKETEEKKKTRYISSSSSSSNQSHAAEAMSEVEEESSEFEDSYTTYRCDIASAEEERVFQLSSSGNGSRADFEEKYQELLPIGSGGFGSVYDGFQRSNYLPVAIKHVPRNCILWKVVTCNGREYKIILEVTLMLMSAGLPGSVGQSAAVSLLDWYLLDEELILVMEQPALCEDLEKYCESHGGSLDENEAKMILKQLVDAAIDMHSKGVFHRDIKLENILIELGSGDPRVRIIDFGCGTFSTESFYTTFCGTPEYFPPEWFRSRAYWVRPTTVWQLGALFYLLLSGHKSFNTKGFIQNRICINKALSKDVKSLLHMCLARGPRSRATLEELQHALS